MKFRTLVWRTVVVALSLLALPAAGSAQGGRAALLDSARVLANAPNARSAIPVLQRALDPTLGPQDSVWASSVQLLVRLLLREGAGDGAQNWLRWAIRQAPNAFASTTGNAPEVDAALQTARAFVSSSAPDLRSSIRFRWSGSSAEDAFGELRLEGTSDDPARQTNAVVNGVGRLDPARPRRLSPGSYRIAARGTDRAGADFSADFTVEVLPGVRTVVTISREPASAILAASTQGKILAQVARIDVARGAESACAVGFFAGSSGLLLTSYRAIRGATTISLQLQDERIPAESVRIAAYDVNTDLAVLTTGASRGDSLPLSGPVASGLSLRAARFPGCGTSPALASVTVTSSSKDSILVSEGLAATDAGAVLVTDAGTVAGLLTAQRSARTIAAASLMATARSAVASGQLLDARDVALREKHAYGEVTLQTSQAGTRVRILPRETWQWPDLARVETLPFTLRGPMGRYQVDVLDGEQVRRRSEVVIYPSATKQVAVDARKKGRSKLLPVLGGLAAGGIAAALAGGGEKPPKTGGITIQLP